MFRVNSLIRFHRVVTLRAGETEQSFGVTFVAPPSSRISEIDDASSYAAIRALLEEAIVDLDDIVGDADLPIPYSPALRDSVFENIEAIPALLAEFRLGLAEAMRGNSNRLPARGQTAA